ncbi:hypothetical protein LCGC14_1904420 [marine sediment metagenome]|uniref:Uncharacterized protein n=1 Tax=marine sediment metagenome TaxID=412755 RepID=A0A0F9FVI3_9ZZZZ
MTEANPGLGRGLGQHSEAKMQVLLGSFVLLDRLHSRLDRARRSVEIGTGGRPICITNCGVCCQRTVPAATQLEAEYVVSLLPLLHGTEVRARALGWMVERHPGLQFWDKVHGRAYQAEEQRLLADDQQALERTRCPFLTVGQECMIYSARPLVCRAYGVTMAQDPECPRPLAPSETTRRRVGLGASGPLAKELLKIKGALVGQVKAQRAQSLLLTSWLPGLVALAVARDELIALRAEGLVADVKLALTTSTPRLWADEPQDTAPASAGVIPVRELALA